MTDSDNCYLYKVSERRFKVYCLKLSLSLNVTLDLSLTCQTVERPQFFRFSFFSPSSTLSMCHKSLLHK